jgi:hypothetical protein
MLGLSAAASAISCVSDAGTAAYAAISASPLANGFTFTETFDMGPMLYQSFGNLDLRAFDLVTDPLSPSGFYAMTVLEQATCTSNKSHCPSDIPGRRVKYDRQNGYLQIIISSACRHR